MSPKLRIEETPPPTALRVVHPVPQPAAQATAPAPVERTAAEQKDLEHWRSLAIRSGERLQYAESQAADLRKAADDARQRFSKYKDRLDRANERINQLMSELVAVSAERDDLRARLASQERIARRVHEYRQSLLQGPIWELFEELAIASPQQAGVEHKQP